MRSIGGYSELEFSSEHEEYYKKMYRLSIGGKALPWLL